MTRVGVFGATGRMGSALCEAIAGDPDLELVAVVDPHHAGFDLREVTKCDVPSLHVAVDPEPFVAAGVEVAVDFTETEAARRNILWAAEHGIHIVVGTTGFTEHDYERFAEAFTTSNCFIAPNFAIGAVLMMRFAEVAARYFDSAEIIELHHDQKRDAPSGTALMTARKMAAAAKEWVPGPTEDEVVPGVRGGKGPGDIRVHAVRLRGLVAHQEVLLGTVGQTLTIRHDSYDRTSFMPGILLAIKAVADRPGVTVGLDQLLDL
ncbi:MAG: 4-hydroxy-tetrahydrodipicolinate reductase [Acidimicrobiales bacterium]